MTEIYEPSVLDYVKQKLVFWKKSELHFPTLEEAAEPILETQTNQLPESKVENQPASLAETFHAIIQSRLPFRTLSAYIIALIAQIQMEPPDPARLTAVVLYLAAFGLAVWAFISKEWVFPEPQADTESSDTYDFRKMFLIAGIPLALLTFLSFSSGLFLFFNTTLWLLTVVVFVLGIAHFSHPLSDWIRRFVSWIKSWPKSFQISAWTLLLIACAGLIIYFRVYRLVEVPLEMTSDHAEKLEDVQDVLSGLTSVFFPRNTGREAFQFYLTALVIKIFNTGISFLSLKIGTVAAGLVIIPFIYLTGKEMWNRRAGLFAALFAGIAYWPNVISRVGLRFSLYPLFVAPFLYFFLRGLRRKTRNDLIWAGIFLGLGLHGYSPYRIVPFLVVIGIALYIIHTTSGRNRIFALSGLGIIAIISLLVFLPLFRYVVSNPDIFAYRALSRVGDLERPLSGPAWQIFLSNLLNAMIMFGYSDGDTWLHSVPMRPALDVISAALFYIGLILVIVRYIWRRHWEDGFLVISIPVLMLPSILSLAFPNENPALNRTAGAIIPVFLIIGLTLDSIIRTIENGWLGNKGKVTGIVVSLLLVLLSMRQNFNLVFNTYDEQYRYSAGNTTEVGKVVRSFADSVGTPDSVWVVGYPYWIDTRLVSITAGYKIKDYAIWPAQFEETRAISGPKMLIFNPLDTADLATFQQMYPAASVSTFKSKIPGRDFLIMLIPAEK